MREGGRDARPGANLKLVQPVSEHVAFTAGRRLQRDARQPDGSGAQRSACRLGNFIRPKEYAKDDPGADGCSAHPLRIRHAPRGQQPAGRRRRSEPARHHRRTITLNGCGSYDPLGLALTYQWTQISGPNVTLSSANTVQRDLHRGRRPDLRIPPDRQATRITQGSATTTVSTATPTAARIVQFTRKPGRHPARPELDPDLGGRECHFRHHHAGRRHGGCESGSVSVTPAQTTTYTLTATGPSGTITLDRDGARSARRRRQSADHPLRSQPADHHVRAAVHAELDHHRRFAR